jgi:hypothetical protein
MPDEANKAALEYAERGWFVFPILPRKKIPYKGFGWKEKSTNDPDVVRAVIEHPRYKDCNWALDCGRSNLLVLDVDIYKPGAAKAFADLPGEVSSPYTVKSPRGGTHYHYEGTGPSTADKLGPGLDTRGAGGYVLIPGSETEDGRYTCETPFSGGLQPPPPFVLESLGPPPPERLPDADIPISDPDQPHHIEQAKAYIKHAPEATEGDGGDATTYYVACKLRDFNLSRMTALEILSEWNEEKANPPWTLDELQKKIDNAYRYAKDKPGNATPEAIFPPGNKSTQAIRCAADTEIEDLKPRAWILGYRYLPEYVTLTIAPGGVGKSLLTIVEGMSVASGKQLTRDVVHQTGAVWLYNTEDPFDELDRRVLAAAKYHRLSRVDLGNFYYSSGYDNPLKLAAADERNRAIINEPLVGAIIKHIKQRNVKLFIVDPFVECHSVNENDNTGIAAVAQTFRRIAKQTGCAVSLVHHTSKGKQERGNMDKSRGASSLISAARIAHTIYPMTPKEAVEYGVQPGRENWYVRLDDAKANLSPPIGSSSWYEKHSVRLHFDSEETTGTLAPAQFGEPELNLHEQLAPLYNLPFDDNGCISLHKACEAMKACGITGAKGGTSVINIRRHIESLFALVGGETPVGVKGFRVRLLVVNGVKILKMEEPK